MGRPTHVRLTVVEKKACLLAIDVDGRIPPQFEDVVERIKRGTHVNEDELGTFSCGDAVTIRSSYIKAKDAPRRSDAVRFHEYVTTMYGDVSTPYIATVLKIVRWKLSPRSSEREYALKVKTHLTTEKKVFGSTVITTDLSSNTRGGRYGEFVGLKKTVAARKPLLIPKVMASNIGRSRNQSDVVVLSRNKYFACTLVADDYEL